MRAKFITFKPNRNGTVAIYLDKGIDKRELCDLEGQEVEIGKPRETESEKYQAGFEAGRLQIYNDFEMFMAAQKGEQK
jgi:hypothetical protein